MIQILFFFYYEFCSFSVKFEFYIYVSDATRDFGRGLCVKYFDIPSKWRIRLTERLMGDMFLRIFFFFFFCFFADDEFCCYSLVKFVKLSFRCLMFGKRNNYFD